MIIRRVRLVSGLVLLTYLATHFINHALGLISLEAMEAGRIWFLALWRNPLATVVLYGALTTHLGLAFYSLYRRRHLRMPLWEALQLVLGLTIPLFLAANIAGTRLAHELFDVKDSYALIVLSLWNVSPLNGIRQAILVTVAWMHGCIGLHFWLRLRPWYWRVVPIFFSVALLLPVLALLGFAKPAARSPISWRGNPTGSTAHCLLQTFLGDPSASFWLALQNWTLQGYVATLALVLLARAIRYTIRRRSRIRLTYPGGIEVAVPRGLTVLEASRFAGIPHTSVCGGRGRCSTCRVRVVRGWDSLPPAKPAEIRVLKRVGAPPNVRLACQLRPTADLSDHTARAGKRSSPAWLHAAFLPGR